jgi:hypothetical protein
MNDEMVTVTINGQETEPMTFDQIYTDFLVGYGITLDEFKTMCNERGGFAPHGGYGNDRVEFVVLPDTVLFLYRK